MMPRPGWPLLITSVVFIGGGLFFTGAVLSGFCHWDPCAWVTAIVVGGPSFVILYWQYTATFRANKSSADILRYLHLLIGVSAIIIGGVAALEAVISGVMPIAGLVLTLVGLGVLFGCIGFLNFRWHKQLTSAPILATLVEDGYEVPRKPDTFRISIRQSLALIAALSIVFAGATLGYRDIPPRVAMHVSPQEARLRLPAGASDVCIRRGSRGTISYNFAIDEVGFWEWTKSAVGSLESEASGVKILPVSGTFEIYDSFAQNQIHTITHGWFYDFHIEDRGHQYAYDADEGRVYYSFHAY